MRRHYRTVVRKSQGRLCVLKTWQETSGCYACPGDIEEQPNKENPRDPGRRYVNAPNLEMVLTYLEDLGCRTAH
jgi:hypothetical protein